MKKKFAFVFLAFSLLCFVSCTHLSGSEKCALLGQVHGGTVIGQSTQVTSSGNTVYSYNIPTFNPVCKFPSTEEEKNLVEELIPEAQKKNKRRQNETIMGYVSGMAFVIVLAIIRANEKKTDSYRW